MKIGSIDNKLPATPVAGERKPGTTGTTGPSTAGAAPASETSAKVALSSQASALASAAGDGSFDAAKVDRVSQALKDGSFKINPEAIADKLIANAQELLTRTYR